jgi:hypothetical protein
MELLHYIFKWRCWRSWWWCLVRGLLSSFYTLDRSVLAGVIQGNPRRRLLEDKHDLPAKVELARKLSRNHLQDVSGRLHVKDGPEWAQ